MIDVGNDGHVTNVLLLVHEGTDLGNGEIDLGKKIGYIFETLNARGEIRNRHISSSGKPRFSGLCVRQMPETDPTRPSNPYGLGLYLIPHRPDIGIVFTILDLVFPG